MEIVFENADGEGHPWVQCPADEIQLAIDLGSSTIEIVDDRVEELVLPPCKTGHDIVCLTPRLHSLDGLHGWPNLWSLTLSGTQISSLAPFAGLSRLISIHLDHLTLCDLSPLLALPRLNTLSLQGSIVHNWEVLSQLRLLAHLHASWSNLDSLAVVSQPFLYGLRASGTRVKDLANLGDNVNIRSLSLSACKMKSLEGLAKMPCLKSLTMREALCDDFSALVDAVSLESLEVAGSTFNDVSMLKDCLELTDVSVRGCSVTGWASLIGSRPMWLEARPGCIPKETRRLLEASGHIVRERQYPNRSDGPRTRPEW